MRGLLERYYLGEDRDSPIRIDVPKGRYSVRSICQSDGSTQPARPSVAVLPLQNLSGYPDKDFIGNGLVEELASLLGGCPEIEVISQYATNDLGINGSSGDDFDKVGKALGAGFLLQGSFQITGDQFHVTLALNETERGRQIARSELAGGTGIFAQEEDEGIFFQPGFPQLCHHRADAVIHVGQHRRKDPAVDVFDVGEFLHVGIGALQRAVHRIVGELEKEGLVVVDC